MLCYGTFWKHFTVWLEPGIAGPLAPSSQATEIPNTLRVHGSQRNSLFPSNKAQLLAGLLKNSRVYYWWGLLLSVMHTGNFVAGEPFSWGPNAW